MGDNTVDCPECGTANDVEGHRNARDDFPEKAGTCPNCSNDLSDLIFDVEDGGSDVDTNSATGD